jgi:hypothetical protein
MEALGSYLFICQRNSTLSRSPLIRKEIDGKTTKVYVNADGYTEAYEDLCCHKLHHWHHTSIAVEALCRTSATGLMEEFCKLGALTIIPKNQKGSVEGEVRGDGRCILRHCCQCSYGPQHF